MQLSSKVNKETLKQFAKKNVRLLGACWKNKKSGVGSDCLNRGTKHLFWMPYSIVHPPSICHPQDKSIPPGPDSPDIPHRRASHGTEICLKKGLTPGIRCLPMVHDDWSCKLTACKGTNPFSLSFHRPKAQISALFSTHSEHFRDRAHHFSEPGKSIFSALLCSI